MNHVNQAQMLTASNEIKTAGGLATDIARLEYAVDQLSEVAGTLAAVTESVCIPLPPPPDAPAPSQAYVTPSADTLASQAVAKLTERTLRVTDRLNGLCGQLRL